jgi:hypothetical protein
MYHDHYCLGDVIAAPSMTCLNDPITLDGLLELLPTTLKNNKKELLHAKIKKTLYQYSDKLSNKFSVKGIDKWTYITRGPTCR